MPEQQNVSFCNKLGEDIACCFDLFRAFAARLPVVSKVVRCAVLFAVLAGVLLLLTTPFVWRELLMIAADVWQVDNRVGQAEAVFVPGGGAHFRPYIAARLYHRGVLRTVLISDVKLTPGDRIGMTVPEVDRTKKLLSILGVPEKDVHVIGNQVGSTYEETLALKEWMTRNGARRVIVPTDGFHSRRMDWIMRRFAGGEDREICVWSCVTPYFDLSEWWTNEYGVVGFQNEILKYIVYRLKY